MKLDAVVILSRQRDSKGAGMTGEDEAALDVVLPGVAEESLQALCSGWLKLAVEDIFPQLLKSFIEDSSRTDLTGARHNILQFEFVSIGNFVADAVPSSTA